jgi:hypothetical protein
MMAYGLDLLANKAAERKAEWEGEVEERKAAILAKVREHELAKELKESKRRKKQRMLKAMEVAAHRDALQQVPLCTIEDMCQATYVRNINYTFNQAGVVRHLVASGRASNACSVLCLRLVSWETLPKA